MEKKLFFSSSVFKFIHSETKTDFKKQRVLSLLRLQIAGSVKSE